MSVLLPLCVEEQSFHRTIAQSPAEMTHRLVYLDWLQDYATPLRQARADLIRTESLLHPHRNYEGGAGAFGCEPNSLIEPERVDCDNNAMPGRTRWDIQRDTSGLIELIHSLGGSVHCVACTLCDGVGKVQVEQDDAPSLYGPKHLYGEPQYRTQTCPRCLGKCEIGGLAEGVTKGATYSTSRGFVSDIYAPTSMFLRPTLQHGTRTTIPAWLAQAFLWHPIERVHVPSRRVIYDSLTPLSVVLSPNDCKFFPKGETLFQHIRRFSALAEEAP